MVRTTRQQRETLKVVWLRATHPSAEPRETYTYRQFRQTVHPGPDCILVRFAGMWVGIEKNGYAHS